MGSPLFQRALGRAVKERRVELGLTQEQVSLASGLHQHWLSNIETGLRNPNYLSLRRLAEALELAPSELVARAEACEADSVAAGESDEAVGFRESG